MSATNDAEAVAEAILAKAKVAAVRDDPEIRRLLMRGATIKERVEQRGATSLRDLNEAELGELREMLDIAEEICIKMEKYQLH